MGRETYIREITHKYITFYISFPLLYPLYHFPIVAFKIFQVKQVCAHIILLIHINYIFFKCGYHI